MEDRTFVLWRESQRVNFNEEDLTADRISAVFRVSVLLKSSKVAIIYYNDIYNDHNIT